MRAVAFRRNYCPKRTTVFLTAKNLTDEVYIFDCTRGIQAGLLPRLVQVGVKYTF